MAQQQTQPNVSQTQATQQPVSQTAQPVAEQTQPVEGQETSVWRKWWFWLIIALVVIGAGVGIWFLLKA